MSWIIRVGSIGNKVGKSGAEGFERRVNVDVITSINCKITSISCHTVAQLIESPIADLARLELDFIAPTSHPLPQAGEGRGEGRVEGVRHKTTSVRINGSNATLKHVGKRPACDAEQVWRNLVSSLVGV